MNKPQECIAIIKPIIEDSPVEDNTLQALSICYRELEQRKYRKQSADSG
jgi:hypothetical protein